MIGCLTVLDMNIQQSRCISLFSENIYQNALFLICETNLVPSWKAVFVSTRFAVLRLVSHESRNIVLDHYRPLLKSSSSSSCLFIKTMTNRIVTIGKTVSEMLK